MQDTQGDTAESGDMCWITRLRRVMRHILYLGLCEVVDKTVWKKKNRVSEEY